MNNKTIIYLVRHGQTQWNVEHKLQGHQDSPLTELGLRQAEWLSDSIANEQIDVIYSSSSPRARRTAEIIRAARKIDLIESHDLKEINLGIWEGKTQAEVKEADPEQFDYFWNDPEKFHVQSSETYQEVSNRSIDLLQKIVQENQGKSILIVTHSVVVKLMMAYFEARPLKEIWKPPYIYPACLCQIELDGEETNIILHGDIQHYQEEPTEG